MPMPPSITQLGLDLGDGIGTLMRRFYPILLGDAYQDASAILALDLEFDLANDLIQTLLTDLVQNVRGITETTRDQIQGLLGKQAEEGWSIEQLADAIRQTGATSSVSRSELIARTETATAYSRGSILAYQESGVVTGMEWLTADSPCPICDPLNGMVVALDKTFDGIPYPPAHPGCRCAIAPVVRS